MKTQNKLNFYSGIIRLQEIIFWIIGILVFLCLIYGYNLIAQENETYNQDTIWLKTGEVIPCKISVDTKNPKFLSITYRNEQGEIIFDQIPLKDVDSSVRKINPSEAVLYTYQIELKGGTVLKGNIMSETNTEIELYVQDIGLVKIKRDQIKKVIPLNGDKEKAKTFWYDNPHATRLFFAPTAIPLKRGEGYYQNIDMYINMFNVGIANNLSVGAGFDIITMFTKLGGEWRPMLNFNIKSGFKVTKDLHLAAGGLYVTWPEQFSAGILYGLGTIGSYNNNFSIGTGWGFVNGKFEENPFIMFGGMVRMTQRLWFVSENWLAPVDQNKYYFLLSYGLRIASPRVAVDVGFINSEDIFEFLVIGIPYVDVVIKFGKKLKSN